MIGSFALLCLLFALAVILGFGLLAALFRLRVLGNVDVLFYRGLALISAAGVITFVILLVATPVMHTRPSDAFAAAVLSMSINLSFFVLFPVTIDRSITVFLLGYMDQEPKASYTSAELKAVFTKKYLGEFHQIDRRMHEQLTSNNVERAGDTYRISAQGQVFVRMSRTIAWLFDVDPRFVGPLIPSEIDEPKPARPSASNSKSHG